MWVIAGTALAWFASYLTNRVQRVQVGQEFGDSCPYTRGIPQGSILEPLFCIYMYIRDAPQCFGHSSYKLFADNITFHIRSHSCRTVTIRLSEDLAAVDGYPERKGLF